MLSPILRHWGLELQFDPEQAPGEHVVDYRDAALPVNLAGRFAASQDARCRFYGAGVVVECGVGRGQVLAVADAAVFDGDDAGRSDALETMLAHLLR